MVVQKVFPSLTAEFHNHKMIPFVLPNVLMIAEESSIQEYATLVLPALEPLFAVQDPIQVCVCVCCVHLLSTWARLGACVHIKSVQIT